MTYSIEVALCSAPYDTLQIQSHESLLWIDKGWGPCKCQIRPIIHETFTWFESIPLVSWRTVSPLPGPSLRCTWIWIPDLPEPTLRQLRIKRSFDMLSLRYPVYRPSMHCYSIPGVHLGQLITHIIFINKNLKYGVHRRQEGQCRNVP